MEHDITKMSIQAAQAHIRMRINNFAWETDPKWKDQLEIISSDLQKYWDHHLKRDSNNKMIKDEKPKKS